MVKTYDTLTQALTYLTFFLQFNVKKLVKIKFTFVLLRQI